MMFLRTLFRLLLVFRFYIGIFIVAFVFWIIARRLGYIGSSNKGTSLPASTPRGNRTSRITEAIILSCATIVSIIWSLLLELPEFFAKASDDVIRIHIIFIAAICIVAVLGIITTLLWRTSVAFAVVVVTCFFSFLFGVRAFDPIRLFGLDPASAQTVEYTFNVNNDLAGVDLWVNDVYLGKIPVKTTLNEFLEKVPYWPEPPEGISDKVRKETIDYRYEGGSNYSERTRWIKFIIPEMPTEFTYELAERKWNESLRDYSERERQQLRGIRLARPRRDDPTEAQRTYYARIQFGDAIGYGHCSSSKGLNSSRGGGRITYSGHCDLQAHFPLREKRIEKLLDIARLAKYEVDHTWFEAMESYGDGGWQAVRKAAYFDWLSTTKQYYASHLEPILSETGMLRVMDEWASWHYELNKVKDKNDAWRTFQKICKEADTQSFYSNDSLTSRAVELLLPKINKEQFVKWALGKVKSRAFHSFAWNNLWNNNLFETNFSGDDYPGTKVSDYVAAHGIFLTDKFLDEQNVNSYNIIEQQITKAILAWQGPVDHASFLFAVALDGPDLEPYLRKCYLASKRGDKRFRNSFSSSDLDDINLWLYLLAHLSGPQVREFRDKYISDFADMTLKLAQERNSFAFNRFDYLALDTDMGSESLGAQLWPRYKQIRESGTDEIGHGILSRLWRYLLLIEPVMPAKIYIQCWRDNVDRYGNFRNALDLLDILPPEKRRLVIEGLMDEVRERPENLKQRNSDEPDPGQASWILRRLERDLVQLSEQEFAEFLMQELKNPGGRGRKLNWIEKMRPGHIVAEMMAKSMDINLRSISVRLLRKHPTPQRFALLKILAEDSDSAFRQTAELAVSELKTLGQMPVNLLSSDTGRASQGQIHESVSANIRLYTNLPDDASKYEMIEKSFPVIREITDVDDKGLPVWEIVEAKVPQIDANSFPGNTVAVVDPVDQKSVEVAEVLGDNIYTLNINSRRTQNIRTSSQARTVTLIDTKGRPIPNAFVDFILREHTNDTIIELTGHKTDSDGQLQTMQIAGVSKYSIKTIRVTHPEYGTANIRYSVRSDGGDIRVPLLKSDSLKNSHAIFGVVLDSDGNPIAGAKVRVYGVQSSYSSIAPVSTNEAEVFTDKDGRFNIYPSGQNIAEPPLLTEYQLRVDAPKSLELPPYTGLHKNGQEAKIIIKQNGYFHTFAFEDINGLITDKNLLRRITLVVIQPDDNRLDLRGDFLTEGGYVSLGKYKPYVSHGMLFETFEITEESPRHIVFREEPGKIFRGRVAHGISGQPLAGAFVIGISAIGSKRIDEITPEQWDILHRQPEGTSSSNDEVARIIRPMYDFDFFTRTDASGRFEVQRRAQKFYSFLAFEENFLPFTYRVNSSGVPGNDIIDVPDIKLFPAAKVKLGFDTSENMPQVMPIPIVDINSSPPWAGIFMESGGFEFNSWRSLKEPTWIYAPAGVNFKLSLRPSSRGRDEWSSLTTIPESIFLEQGETLDLGLVKLEPAVRVTVKVVNSKGEPVEGISITRFQYDDNIRYTVGQTNPDGILYMSLNAHSKGELWARLGLDYVAAKIPFEIGGQEEAGCEFQLVLTEQP